MAGGTVVCCRGRRFLQRTVRLLTFAAESLPMARLFSAGFGLFAGCLAANAFAAAYDVDGSGESRSRIGGVLNMMGGLSSPR